MVKKKKCYLAVSGVKEGIYKEKIKSRRNGIVFTSSPKEAELLIIPLENKARFTDEQKDLMKNYGSTHEISIVDVELLLESDYDFERDFTENTYLSSEKEYTEERYEECFTPEM